MANILYAKNDSFWLAADEDMSWFYPAAEHLSCLRGTSSLSSGNFRLDLGGSFGRSVCSRALPIRFLMLVAKYPTLYNMLLQPRDTHELKSHSCLRRPQSETVFAKLWRYGRNEKC